ncbi:MAG: tRNA uridine-5-carboxymethylaminomethyl(34) synthesis GTPase MnmE [Rhodanobacteraceae bacterium]
MQARKPDAMNMPGDTVVAIATPPGIGGIGILRVSGPLCRGIAESFLGHAARPRHAHVCVFGDGAGDLIDRGLLLWFPGPHSFTGEDVLELHAHGSPVALGMLQARVVELGALPARPGEFSERAFLNGKLDLTQAEAIADLIASGSTAAARAALRSLEGEFSDRVRRLTAALIRLRGYLEAAIDFADEQIDFLATPEVFQHLDVLQSDLAGLLIETQRGVRLTDGLHVVIAGKPNAGKSSLLNKLAQSDRAIVTEIAGTTRDVLRETIELDGVAVALVDTAGLRESEDAIEREGVRRARAELALADVALLVTEDDLEDDASIPGDLADGAIGIVIHNKIDLRGGVPRRRMCGTNVHLWLSALSGEGLDLLRTELKRAAAYEESSGGSFSARIRHVNALERAGRELDSARVALFQQQAIELALEDLRRVQEALGEITGEFSNEDLLGKIFSTFCIGK